MQPPLSILRTDSNVHLEGNCTTQDWLTVLGCNDTSTLVGHSVLSPREREKRDSRRDEREEQGRKRNRNVKVKKQKK